MLALAHSDHDAVPRAHRRRPVGRQHLDGARLRRRRHRAEGSRARLRADRRGVRPGIHLRSGAERRAGEGQLHRADLGGRGASRWWRRRWRGSGCPRRSIARRPAPACRSGICRRCCGVRACGRVLVIDFVYWFAFAIFQTTFALFVARRFRFDASQTGYFFAGVRRARRRRAGRLHPADRAPARRQADVHRRAGVFGGRPGRGDA